MIFFLRIIIFSFFIILGFRISVHSIKGRAITSVVYGFVLIFYTFLIRVKITVDVAASDYGHTSVTMSTGEKVLQLLRAIFGMQANGNLAGNYREAFVLNVLFVDDPTRVLMPPVDDLWRFICPWFNSGKRNKRGDHR
jgi:hypothetical protein